MFNSRGMFLLSFCSDDDEDELVLDVKCHYSQAEVVNCIFDLGDCTYVKVSFHYFQAGLPLKKTYS